jgi:putative resolvase
VPGCRPSASAAIWAGRVARLAGYLTAKGVAASKAVCEVGSGLNGYRTRLLSLLRDASVGTVVAGQRERLARFGVGCRVAAFAVRGRELIVAGQAEVSDDLVRDMVEVRHTLPGAAVSRDQAG